MQDFSSFARWQGYLTLLNLRNWDVLDGRPVTEQSYLHSKLIIADDRVAILGSANINDRSQSGNRDPELAVDRTNQQRVAAAREVRLGYHQGPTYESLLVTYGSPQGVIAAATRSNVAMDILTGIAKVSP